MSLVAFTSIGIGPREMQRRLQDMTLPVQISTAVALGASASFTSAFFTAIDATSIIGLIIGDQTGTFVIQWSSDGVAVEGEDGPFTHNANDLTAFERPQFAEFYRVVYTNGTTPQTSFKLTASKRKH